MNNALRSTTLLALTATVLAGCGSVEDRINKAIPVGKDVEEAKIALDKTAKDLPSEKRDALEAQYHSQLKLRALDCSAGYQPSSFASVETIKKDIGNAECFTSADAKLRQWIGMRHAGLLAAMPPLRPVPSQAPAMVVATDRIMRAAFAEEAGVAALQVGSHYELMDLNNGKSIRIGEQGNGAPTLSPNGRVIVTSVDHEARLQNAETGESLGTVTDVGGGRVYWARDKGLVYLKGEDKVAFFDWTSGTESTVPMDSRALTAVIPVPGKSDTFVLFGANRAITLKLDCNENACAPRLLTEAKISGSGYWGTSIAIVGGDAFISGNKALSRIQLDTLKSQVTSFDPIYVGEIVATRNPDTLILKGGAEYGGSGAFLYSIKNQTLAKIDTERLLSTRLSYAAPLHSVVSIDGSKLVVVNDFPAAPPVALESAISAMQFEAQAAKLEMMDRMQALRAAMSNIDSQRSFPSSAAPRQVASAPSRSFPAGEAGLIEAMRAGVLRLGSSSDVDAWKRSYLSTTGKSLGRDFDEHINHMKVYVITGDMVIPADLAGANAVVFVLSRGTPYPRGNPGHSPILDMKSGSCGGMICSMIVR